MVKFCKQRVASQSLHDSGQRGRVLPGTAVGSIIMQERRILPPVYAPCLSLISLPSMPCGNTSAWAYPDAPPAGRQHPAEPRVARGEPLPLLSVQRGQEADHDARVSPGGRGAAATPPEGANWRRHAGPDAEEHLPLPGQDLTHPHQNQVGYAGLVWSGLVWSGPLLVSATPSPVTALQLQTPRGGSRGKAVTGDGVAALQTPRGGSRGKAVTGDGVAALQTPRGGSRGKAVTGGGVAALQTPDGGSRGKAVTGDGVAALQTPRGGSRGKAVTGGGVAASQTPGGGSRGKAVTGDGVAALQTPDGGSRGKAVTGDGVAALQTPDGGSRGEAVTGDGLSPNPNPNP